MALSFDKRIQPKGPWDNHMKDNHMKETGTICVDVKEELDKVKDPYWASMAWINSEENLYIWTGEHWELFQNS